MGSVRGANGEVTEMSFKYIKAEEAEERIVALWRKEKGAYADTFNTAIDACQTIILDMYDNSSRDVVPVVRCKDCKYFHYNKAYNIQGFSIMGNSVCDKWANGCRTDEDGYCFLGERREDETC